MLNEEIREKLLDILREKPDGISTLELATTAGVNRITVSKYMAAMQAEGLVHFMFLGQSKIWKLNKEGNKPVVYIVDDEPHVLKLLRIVFSDSDYDVHACYSGYEFLDKAKNKKPDLVILDVMMPGLDGFSVAEQMAEDGRFSDVPIIFLSAKSAITDRLKGINLGALYYMTKPFSPKALRDKTESVLRLHKSFLRNDITHLPKRKLFLEQKQELGLTEGYNVYRIEVSHLQQLEDAFGMLKLNEFLILFAGLLKDTLVEMQTKYIVGHAGNEYLVCVPKEKEQEFSKRLLESVHSFLPFIYECEQCDAELGGKLRLKEKSMDVDVIDVSIREYKESYESE